MRKKIFITISDGEVSKSILQSDIFPLLAAKADIVLLVHPRKVAYFTERVGSPTVTVVPIPRPSSATLEEIWNDLFLFSLHTESIRVKIEYSYRSGGTFVGKMIKLTLWQLGRFRAYRAICRWIYGVFTDAHIENLLDAQKPDLIFAANLTSGEDARLLRAARKRGIRSVGMPKGWDNLTLKTFLPIFPDYLLVQTPLLKKDAESLDYPGAQISVVGFPKFDVYANTSQIPSRGVFMQSIGLDAERKLILYAGAGDQLAPQDEDILANFLEAVDDGRIMGRLQVLVRPHPKYTYRDEILPRKNFWVLDRPGTIIGEQQANFEFSKADVEHLMNSLYHCDILIHTASTLGVEASIFNKPSITIGFEARPIPEAVSTSRYYRYEHYGRVLATGGMKVARSFGDLVHYTNDYLARPESDHGARMRIVEENAYRIDGKAGERVANEIIRMLRSTTHGNQA